MSADADGEYPLQTEVPFLFGIEEREDETAAGGIYVDRNVITGLGIVDEIAIYEFNEVEGTATVLDTYHGLPSDENFLNRMLEKTNEDFAELLEIQQEYD